MGAWMTQQVGIGKTVADAHRNAVAAAAAENGHQDGYSGAINSGGGFALVTLPPRVTVAKFMALLEDAGHDDDAESLRESIAWRKRILDQGTCKRSDRPAVRAAMKRDEQALRQTLSAQAKHAKAVAAAGFTPYSFAALVETYNDKWGDYLAVELRGAEKKRYASRLRRGERAWIFFGYAPS